MSTAHNPIRLYETVIDECPYLPDKQSASLLVDPEHTIDADLFALLSRSGFRRSGDMLYSPKCPDCNACISVRIPVDTFQASRGQKRTWKRNQDLQVFVDEVEFREQEFELYLKYQQARHPQSSMCDEDPKKYISFINSYFSESQFLSFYLNNELIGISVVDQFQHGLSAVYTFFDPDHQARSIGTYAILYMIKMARLQRIPYVYLGYWIDGSQKMDYKRRFKPLEGYRDRKWVELSLEK